VEYDRLSDRTNIVVIADEAHRTQYGFEAKLIDEKDRDTKEVIGKRIAYGFAKYMRDALPNATYIGFTGTPIESTDINTPAVFGQYVDIYDISQSVADGATVKIYYESRLAKVNLDEDGRRLIAEFDKELEADEELSDKQRAKAKWTKLEAIVGNEKRIKNLAKDIVTHFEQRQAVIDGKGMIKVKANATIDWTIRESARARLMVLVKRTLTKYGYPPDKQQKAVDTVLKQAELLADYFIQGKDSGQA